MIILKKADFVHDRMGCLAESKSDPYIQQDPDS